LPGAEAATEEEAVAAVTMTCFVVGCGLMFCVFGLVAVCVQVNKPGTPAEIT
jgi:hypothetical protein